MIDEQPESVSRGAKKIQEARERIRKQGEKDEAVREEMLEQKAKSKDFDRG
jgi:hypothetical protein